MARFDKRIFISYSHDSDEHRARVRQLADSFCRDGLDCRIDQYLDSDPPEGWPLWMEKEIELAHVVLLVCTAIYQRRVRKEEAPGLGRGVCWEANLIYAALYESQTYNNKFFPIIFREDDRQWVPGPLGAASIHVVNNDVSYQRLYAFLTEQHLSRPSIGVPKSVMLQEPLPLFSLPGAVIEAPSIIIPRVKPPRVEEPLAPPAIEPSIRRQLIPNRTPTRRFELRQLDWYEEEDAEYFLGREDQVKTLRNLLLDSPVVRLFGPSGVGKSSLLRAGLKPLLRTLQWRIAVVRPFEVPHKHIPMALSHQLLTPSSQPFSQVLNVDTLRAELVPLLAAEGCHVLILLIDQFEDIVSPFAPDNTRESMTQFLQALVSTVDHSLQIKAVVAYRTDAETRLGSLWQAVSGRPSGLPYLAIEGLSYHDTEQIIQQIAKKKAWDMPMAVQRLVEQLMYESQSLDASGDVFPPYLQILLSTLNTKSDQLLNISIFDELGGLGGVIGKYLDGIIGTLEAQGGDHSKCRRLLEVLCRSTGRKASVSLSELANEVGLSPQATGRVIRDMVRQRLVRPVGHELFEIQHDRLAEAVLTSMTDSTREAKQVQELLAVKAVNFHKTQEWLSLSEQHFLYLHRQRIRLRKEEQFLVIGSLLHHEDGIGWWFFQNNSVEQTADLLTQLAHHGTIKVQRIAINVLAQWQRVEDAPLFCDLVQTVADIELRRVALNVLAQWQRVEDVPLFCDLVQTVADIEPRRVALNVLAQWQRVEDAPLFCDLVQTVADIELRRVALNVLAQWQRVEDVPLFCDLIQTTGDVEVRQIALSALAQWQRVEDAPLFRELVQTATDAKIRRIALSALAQWQRAEDAPLFRELVQTATDAEIRRIALSALAQWQRAEDAPLFRELVQTATDARDYVGLPSAPWRSGNGLRMRRCSESWYRRRRMLRYVGLPSAPWRSGNGLRTCRYSATWPRQR